MHSHLAGNMGQDAMAVFQFHSKHGIGQGFDHPAFNFYSLFFRHNLRLLNPGISDPRVPREAAVTVSGSESPARSP